MAILVQSLAFVSMAQWFKLGGLRCSPLNAALGFSNSIRRIFYEI
ncbi:hypothetical protein IFVP22_C1210014 [Vibrio parahaemolyticus]